jgi:Cu(I)/Ag(I) efflux system membrane fusion protein
MTPLPLRAIWRSIALSALALLSACNRAEPPIDTASAPTASVGSKPVLYYYDPMRPETHFDKPGQSPFMDMALVPKYAETADTPGIAVDAAVVQSLGIRIAVPVRRDVRPSVRVPARVVADARSQARLQARVSGWIERLLVRAAGQRVRAGDPIAEIYSPELVQAQEEMLLDVDAAGPAIERLRRFGIANIDIQAVRRAGKASRRLSLRAPTSGVVTELGVREGSSVSSETVIADFSASNAVWIEAQVFPAQRIDLGKTMSARFTLPGLPGKEWLGENGVVVPMADVTTQTMAVRFQVNQADDLPLGTVLDAEIDGTPRTGVLLAPASAVIRTAKDNRVLIENGAHRFVPTPVMLGQHYGEEVEILAGLTESDHIVTSGQFLLDAEANLQSGISRMGGADQAGETP